MKRDFRGLLYFNAIAITILIVVGVYRYLFFHAVIELVTVFIGISIYIVSAYSRVFTKGSNLIFIGISYLFIGTLDLLHVLTNEGFGLLEIGINESIQFWLSARFFEGFILFFAFFNLHKLKDSKSNNIFSALTLVLIVIILSVVYNDYLPEMYVVGEGYTLYKKFIDVVIIMVFSLAIFAIYKKESRTFNKRVLIAAICLKIISQIALLVSSGDTLFLEIGAHISMYLSYVALFMVFVREALTRPYENVFRAYKEKEIELIEIAKRDSLTGLYNHSNSYKIMSELIQSNSGKKTNLCLMMIDIDDFKCINDKYGHVKGDEILLKIANIFKVCEGPISLAGRYGGDEFIVLFSDCNKELAKDLVKKIFNKMELLSEEVEVNVTLSIGVAEWKVGYSAKDLVRTADFQMYEAKALGKSTYSIN